MYVATGGPNVKWRAPISNGGAGHHCPPPLATALDFNRAKLAIATSLEALKATEKHAKFQLKNSSFQLVAKSF